MKLKSFPVRKRNRLRNWMLNLLLICFSTFFTLLAVFIVGEIWIRSRELPADTGSIYNKREDQLPTFVLKPGANETATGAPVSINSLGFRGREYTQAKPEGTKRIIVLGDSFAFGAGAPVDVIFSTRLEEMLAQNEEHEVEVLNLGVSDYNSDDQLALFKEKGLQLSPDLVLLFYVMNDIEIKKDYLELEKPQGDGQPTEPAVKGEEVRQYRDPLYNLVNSLRKKSHFLGYLAPRVASLGRAFGFNVASSGAFYSTAFADNVEGWQRSKAALREIKRLSEEDGAQFGLVLFPLMTSFTDKYPAKRSHEVIGEFAADEGIPFLDLLPFYMDKKAESLWVSPTDGHPNAEGHQIAADAVFGFLQETPSLHEALQP